MKIAVVGSRGYSDRGAVEALIASLPPKTTVITGGARGVDTWALGAAQNRRDLDWSVYYPEWETYGKKAGPMRNQIIVDEADKVVAFWDGKSRGTADTIARAKKAGKPVEVVAS